MAMKFEDLISRVMKDAKFRTDLKTNPGPTLQSVGVKSTPALEQSLKSLDWNSLDTVNTHYKAAAGIST